MERHTPNNTSLFIHTLAPSHAPKCSPHFRPQIESIPLDDPTIAMFKEAYAGCYEVIQTVANLAIPPPGGQIVGAALVITAMIIKVCGMCGVWVGTGAGLPAGRCAHRAVRARHHADNHRSVWDVWVWGGGTGAGLPAGRCAHRA
eukprot:364051-Chlamydomonas_euryale.AAC.1